MKINEIENLVAYEDDPQTIYKVIIKFKSKNNST